jgi:hypothetical protein
MCLYVGFKEDIVQEHNGVFPRLDGELIYAHLAPVTAKTADTCKIHTHLPNSVSGLSYKPIESKMSTLLRRSSPNPTMSVISADIPAPVYRISVICW